MELGVENVLLLAVFAAAAAVRGYVCVYIFVCVHRVMLAYMRVVVVGMFFSFCFSLFLSHSHFGTFVWPAVFLCFRTLNTHDTHLVIHSKLCCALHCRFLFVFFSLVVFAFVFVCRDLSALSGVFVVDVVVAVALFGVGSRLSYPSLDKSLERSLLLLLWLRRLHVGREASGTARAHSFARLPVHCDGKVCTLCCYRSFFFRSCCSIIFIPRLTRCTVRHAVFFIISMSFIPNRTYRFLT